MSEADEQHVCFCGLYISKLALYKSNSACWSGPSRHHLIKRRLSSTWQLNNVSLGVQLQSLTHVFNHTYIIVYHCVIYTLRITYKTDATFSYCVTCFNYSIPIVLQYSNCCRAMTRFNKQDHTQIAFLKSLWN